MSNGYGLYMRPSTKYRTVPAGEFKNACLKIMDDVSKERIPITVTKRGRPLVQIVPVPETEAPDLRGTIVHEDADIFSTGEEWEADRE